MAGDPVSLLSAREQGLEPDLRLAALLYLPAGLCPSPAGASAQAPGLVVGHGAGSRASRHAEFCQEACKRGFAVLAPDFRGHGDSEGRADGPLEQDVLAAVHFLRSLPGVDAAGICYRGSSMGGFYGLKAAPLAGFAAAVLICPAGPEAMLRSLDDSCGVRGDTERPDRPDGQGTAAPARPDSTRWDIPHLRAYFERQDSLELAAMVACPIMLVHARPDAQVPLAHSLALAQHLRADTSLLILSEGNHSWAQHDPTVHARSLDWLWEQIKKRRAALQLD